MNISIVNFNNDIIKTFNSINMPDVFKRDKYILETVLENKYTNMILEYINENTIKIMTYDEFKIYGSDFRKKHRNDKKKKELDIIEKKNEEEIIKDESTNINLVDFDGNLLKIITQQFKKKKFLLYKPFIQKEFPNMYDVEIDENTIKIMNIEQYTNYKKEQNRKYREINKEKLIEYDRKYNHEHKNEINEKQKIYSHKNKEKIKQYREANKEKIKKYKEDHKEEIKLKRKEYYKKKQK
jgi:hypothetical protein